MSKLTNKFAAAAVAGLTCVAAPVVAETIVYSDIKDSFNDTVYDGERLFFLQGGVGAVVGIGVLEGLQVVGLPNDEEFEFIATQDATEGDYPLLGAAYAFNPYGLVDLGDGLYSQTKIITDETPTDSGDDFPGTPVAREFAAGSTVGAADVATSSGAPFGQLYGEGGGMLNYVASEAKDSGPDSGYIGFSVDVFQASTQEQACGRFRLGDDSSCILRGNPGLGRDAPQEEVDNDGFMLLTGTYYGWMELTRGSVIVGNYGINSAVGESASIGMSPVPLPAGLPLLLVGLGAFGAVRARKSRTA